MRDALRLEDVLLIVWVACQPVVLRALGHGPSASGSSSAGSSGGLALLDGHDPLLGLVASLAVVGALVCLATHPAPLGDGSVVAVADRGTVGPLAGGMLLVGAVGTQNLFDTVGAGFAVVLVAIGVASLLPDALPPIAVPDRRALVTPYLLVAASLFNGLIGQLGGLFDLRGLLDQGLGPTLQALPVYVGFVLAFCGVYYLMLVYAPRQLATADGGVVAWLIRFATFVVAEVVVVTWLAGAS
ncbi:MAG: hypothetical protein ACHQZR_05080 [Candidatus Limnocylindrales bacterium]